MSVLKGKVALVTGSSRGIGAAISVALAKLGADVIVHYASTSSKASAEATAKKVESYGSKTIVVQANIASMEEIESLVQKTVARFGKIDILVNNAAVGDFVPIGMISQENYNSTFDVNVRGTIFLSQAVVPHMGDGGRIINVSSVAARIGLPASTVYAASKAAVESVTRVMGLELRDRGIRVNAVNPGPTETERWLSRTPEIRAATTAIAPLAKPEDIADVVAFLAGPGSRWVNGTTVSTNNGVILN